MAAAMAAEAAAQGQRFEAQKLHPDDGIDKLIEEATTWMYFKHHLSIYYIATFMEQSSWV